MGIGVLYGHGNHGLSGLSDVDGDGRGAQGLPLACLHCIGEKVAQDGTEVNLRNRKVLGQGYGGIHGNPLGLGGLYVIIEQGIGGGVLAVLGGVQGLVGA